MYTSDFLKLLFSNNKSYTSDIYDHQIQVGKLIESRSYIGQEDVFFTPNNMKPGKGRSKKDTTSINCVKLDLDTVKNGQSPSFSIFKILNDVEILSIPVPTAIINSTGGLHIYWVLDKPVKVTAIGAHDKIVSTLCEKLKDYGPTRLLLLISHESFAFLCQLTVKGIKK